MTVISIADQLTKIFAAMDAGQRIEDMMRADETAAGRVVVRPGDRPWFSADDWDPTVVVSIDGKVVRLIAILARRQGYGAFRRLVTAIRNAGLTPCIICPTNEMRATMQRWNWRRRDVGDGIDREERWYPRAR